MTEFVPGDSFARILASAPQVGHWLTKDGGRRLIAWSNKPMVSAVGGPTTIVTTGIDLTDRAPRTDEEDRALAGDPEAKLAEVGRLATEQRALRRVATLVASEAQPERVFSAVSEECARVLDVNASAVLRYEDDETATVVGRHNRDSVGVFQVGERIATDVNSTAGQVRRTGAAARVDDWGSSTRGVTAETMLQSGYRSTAAAPIVVAGTLWGAVAIASEDPLPPDSENRLAGFCELVSLAVASAQARADLVASRARPAPGDPHRPRSGAGARDARGAAPGAGGDRRPGASHARVAIRVDGDTVRCEIADDGRGGADVSLGTGIQGLRDRAEAAGGTLSLASPAGRGTVVTAAVPLARG